MARLYMTGFETGSTSPFSGVTTAQKRGSWSTYGCVGATGQVPLFTTGVTEFYTGFGFYAGSFVNGRLMAVFYSMNVVLDLYLDTDAAGHIRVNRGNGTQLTISTNTMTAATWYFVEVHATIHDTTGSVEVKVDGVQWSTGSSLDTRNDAATDGDKVNRVGFSDGGNYYVDDFYFNDTTGSQNNGYSGDTRIAAYIPNAAGDSTGLTRGGSDSGNNYGQVDERPPNDGTDYVFGTDTSSYDLYNLPATSGVSTVQGVQLWVRAAKSDAGAANIALMLKSGGTEDQQADQALSTSYGYFVKTYDVDPTDSAAWTAAKVDGLQIGVKSR